MWKDYISNLLEEAEFTQSATIEEISVVEEELKVKFTEELRSILLESNGVFGEYGLGLVWPLDRIRENNISFRNSADFKELYMPFDCLLFFADAGNGDMFAYAILDGEIRRDDIFVWNHEDDSRTWASSSLKRYIKGWIDGSISI